jgi:hypothetical protein
MQGSCGCIEKAVLAVSGLGPTAIRVASELRIVTRDERVVWKLGTPRVCVSYIRLFENGITVGVASVLKNDYFLR